MKIFLTKEERIVNKALRNSSNLFDFVQTYGKCKRNTKTHSNHLEFNWECELLYNNIKFIADSNILMGKMIVVNNYATVSILSKDNPYCVWRDRRWLYNKDWKKEIKKTMLEIVIKHKQQKENYNNQMKTVFKNNKRVGKQ